MRYALCNEVLRHLSWEDACYQMAQVGYEGVEIAPFTFAESVLTLDSGTRALIRQTARLHKLEIVGLHMLLWSPPGLHVAHPDPAVRQRTADYIAALVEFASDIGARLMVFGSPKQRSSLPPFTPAESAQMWLETLQLALKRCEQVGVTILIEPLPETDVIQRLGEAVTLVQQANHRYLKTMLDVKSALAETDDVAGLIRQYAPWIAHVHLNDSNLRAPGYGETDFAPILSALKEIGYQGWCSLEPFDYSPSPEVMMAESLRYLKQLG
ncbi:MAG: sugar phosphate isomerase/epimerase family protein [Fimbriimonadales bacterium]